VVEGSWATPNGGRFSRVNSEEMAVQKNSQDVKSNGKKLCEKLQDKEFVSRR
jgi:hypothetical protein